MHGGGRKEVVTFEAPNVWRLNHDSSVSDFSFPYRTSWVHSSELLPWMSCSLHWWLWLIVTWSRIARPPLPVPCRVQSAQVTRRGWSGRIRIKKVQSLKMLLSTQSVSSDSRLSELGYTFIVQRQLTDRDVQTRVVARLRYFTLCGKSAFQEKSAVFFSLLLLWWLF